MASVLWDTLAEKEGDTHDQTGRDQGADGAGRGDAVQVGCCGWVVDFGGAGLVVGARDRSEGIDNREDRAGDGGA